MTFVRSSSLLNLAGATLLRRDRAIFVLSTLLLVACGSSREGFEPTTDTSRTDMGPVGSSSSSPSSSDLACAKATLESHVRTVDLVVMFDRSASMLETLGATKTTRWVAAGQAMKAFLASAPPSSMQASLSFFGAGVKRQEVCDASSYLVPRVTLRPLPDTTNSFASVFETTFPNGSTPTAAALSGAILQAHAIGQKSAEERAVVVLVTDGLPEGCDEADDPARAIAVAKDGLETSAIPTFVVGVGPKLDNLHAIAAAGGTTKAFLVDEASPEDLSKALGDALSAIRDAAGTCAVDIPAPEAAGDVLDLSKVNVTLDGASAPIAQSESCDGDGVGWHYDDAKKRIVLCPSSCAEVKGGRPVRLTFGCATVLK